MAISVEKSGSRVALPQMVGPLEGVLARCERTGVTESRRPGRPKKRTPDYLTAVLDTYRALFVWFVQEFGAQPRSDRELYSKYFAYQFIQRGQRESRVNEPRFKGSLRTALNELSEARRCERERHRKGDVSVTHT